MNKIPGPGAGFLLTACSGTAAPRSHRRLPDLFQPAHLVVLRRRWSYDDQAAWEIVEGQYQSPIDIRNERSGRR